MTSIVENPRSATIAVENSGINPQIVFSILEKYRSRIPKDVWVASLEKINRTFEEFKDPEKKATSAFFVHTRRDRNESDVPDKSFINLDDSSRFFPALSPKYGISESAVEAIWHSLPPFKTGEIKGIAGGREVNCAIISVPITPKGLENCRSSSERASYARPRIVQTAELADRMGANIIGLGETLAALTSHGRKLQERFSLKNITTGHAFTAYFMSKWTKFAAENNNINIVNSPVTIIGANGSIGSAMTEALLLEGASELRLHDKENMVGALEKRKREILEKYPNKIIVVTGGNSNLREACRGSRIVLVAASSPKPFIKAEHLDKGTIVINDSQPPSITREEAQSANSKTIWVVGTLPEGLVNTFDSGLIHADWTCALEVIGLEIVGVNEFETVGPVTPDRVRAAGKIAEKLGIGLASPQSWGEMEEIKFFSSGINLQ